MPWTSASAMHTAFGDYYSSLSEPQKNQCTVLADYFSAKGWTLNAICGMLGNIQHECTLNCNLYSKYYTSAYNAEQNGYSALISWINTQRENDVDLAYGLTQWHYPDKYITWAYNNGLDWRLWTSQVARIDYEVEHNEQWSADRISSSSVAGHAYTFKEFTQLTEDPAMLAWWFNRAYEKSASSYTGSTERQENATRIYYYLKSQKIPIWLLFKMKERNEGKYE